LVADGFTVDCAPSGTAGLALAHARTYAAIMLALPLRDMDGLFVLQQLRAAIGHTPVIVLTDRPDVESAVTAMKLGAFDYRLKPRLRNELRLTVGTISDGIDGHSRLPAMPSPAPSSTAATIGDAVFTSRLCRALLAPELPVSTFLTHARVLRQILTTRDSHARVSAGAPHMRASEPPQDVAIHHAVAKALCTLERHLVMRVRPTEQRLADDLHVTRAHLGRLLRSNTGIGFRKWRTMLAMKVAVRRLNESDKYIAQIAYDLGFDHPSQFDREFRYVFGVSPRTLRGFLQRRHQQVEVFDNGEVRSDK
jgi:AraC-like DNA-binding protein